MDNKEKRKIRRESRVCIVCSHQDARTLAGYCRCKKCAKKHNEQNKIGYSENKGKIAEYQKERRARLKAEGLCIVCGRENAVEGHTLCQYCLDRLRIGTKLRRNKNAEK